MIIRIAGQEDAQKIIEWMQKNEIAEFGVGDAEALSHPLTEIFCAENGKPLAYIPVQLVGMLMPIGFNPESTPEERKDAVYTSLDAIITQIRKYKVRELIFYSDDEKAIERAESIGFRQVKGVVLRKVLHEIL